MMLAASNQASVPSMQNLRDALLEFAHGRYRVCHRSVFYRCSTAMDIVTVDGRILDCNDEYLALVSRDKSTVLKSTIWALTHDESKRSLTVTISTALSQKFASEIKKIALPDGRALTVRTFVWTVYENEQPKFMCAALTPVGN